MAEKIRTALTMAQDGADEVTIAAECGVSRSTIRRWLRPAEAELSRAVSRAWKRRNPEAVADYASKYAAQRRHDGCRSGTPGSCLKCGVECLLSGLCPTCTAERDRQRIRLVYRALDGGCSIAQIAAALRVSEGTVRQIAAAAADYGIKP